ncbi:MAG: hypothetical protein WDN49_09175 [Acetobacteraceae bacterium]
MRLPAPLLPAHGQSTDGIAAQPRTDTLVTHDDRLQAHFGASGSTPIFPSRSVDGHSDLGMNSRRVGQTAPDARVAR